MSERKSHQLGSDVAELLSQTPTDFESVRRRVVAVYNEATGKTLDARALTDQDLDEVVTWLRKTGASTDLVVKRGVLFQPFYLGIEDKVNFLAQRKCTACDLAAPVWTIPVRLPAISQQSSEGRVVAAFRRAMDVRLSGTFAASSNTDWCLRIVFMLRAARPRRIDVDNLAKGVVDALKGVVYMDDDQVRHLDLLKLDGRTEEDFFVLHLAVTTVNALDDVLRSRFEALFTEEAIRLSDFMED